MQHFIIIILWPEDCFVCTGSSHYYWLYLCVCACLKPVVTRLCACQLAEILPTREEGVGSGGQNNSGCQEPVSVCESHNTTDLFLLRNRKWECVCTQTPLASFSQGEVECVFVCMCAFSLKRDHVCPPSPPAPNRRLRLVHVLPTEESNSSSSRADASALSGATIKHKQEVDGQTGGPMRATITAQPFRQQTVLKMKASYIFTSLPSFLKFQF